MGRGSSRYAEYPADLQLAVVVSSLTQHHPDLAISNILGSCTANILGSFSVGLCFASANLTISDQDKSSSRIYSGLLVIIGGLVALFGPGWGLVTGLFGRRETLGASRWAGIILLVAFAFYVGGIVYGIQKGNIIAPEGSDSDSDTSDEATSESEDEDEPSEESGDRRRIPVVTSITGEGKLCIHPTINVAHVRGTNSASPSIWTDPQDTPCTHIPSYHQAHTICRPPHTLRYLTVFHHVLASRSFAHHTIDSGFDHPFDRYNPSREACRVQVGSKSPGWSTGCQYRRLQRVSPDSCAWGSMDCSGPHALGGAG